MHAAVNARTLCGQAPGPGNRPRGGRSAVRSSPRIVLPFRVALSESIALKPQRIVLSDIRQTVVTMLEHFCRQVPSCTTLSERRCGRLGITHGNQPLKGQSDNATALKSGCMWMLEDGLLIVDNVFFAQVTWPTQLKGLSRHSR